MTGVFPSVLKTAKVVPVFKKDSKLDYSNYRPISLLSNVEKILEKLMYKRLYTFLNSNNIIYNLQFGFRQQYSTSHALVNITENIRKALDGGNIGCGIFVDLQKAFDTVDHQILLTKLNHYGIRGVSNDWFKSYLSNRNQYVFINGFDSGLAAINCGVPQGSVLGPLLFLLHINDLNHTIKFCKVHHFADDTNLLCMSNSIKKLNKLVNADLENLVHWLNANKISLNVKKTEMVIFKSKQKKFEGDLKIKLCGKRLYPSESVKYLGVKIDTNLNWEHHVNDLSIKLNRHNALLFKMRKYVSLKILRSIYFAIFDSYLSYCCLVWAQNSSTIQQIVILQKKAARIINFQPRNSHTSPLFKQSSILKFQDKICLENILFVSKSLNNLSPSVFNTWFVFSSGQHETSSSTQGILIKLFYKTNRYGKYSLTISAAESWNKIQKQLKGTLFKDLSPNKIKTAVSNFYFKSY